MREILFRGKGEAGTWLYGVPLVYSEDVVFITCAYERSELVIPETVGQYTGLTDKNGTKVFEGDIMRGAIGDYVVIFDENFYGFDWERVDRNCPGDSFSGFADEYEVIGNIHDNKELLEG
jgi:hypothetical protein